MAAAGIDDRSAPLARINENVQAQFLQYLTSQDLGRCMATGKNLHKTIKEPDLPLNVPLYARVQYGKELAQMRRWELINLLQPNTNREATATMPFLNHEVHHALARINRQECRATRYCMSQRLTMILSIAGLVVGGLTYANGHETTGIVLMAIGGALLLTSCLLLLTGQEIKLGNWLRVRGVEPPRIPSPNPDDVIYPFF